MRDAQGLCCSRSILWVLAHVCARFRAHMSSARPQGDHPSPRQILAKIGRGEKIRFFRCGMEEDVDWDGGMPSWCDKRRVEDLVKFINAPSKPPTEHEQKHSRKIERRWRRWAARLSMREYRSYVRTIRRRWRRCLTRLLIDEYREYVRAIPWSRLSRRLLLDGRHYSLSTFHSIRTKWRTLTAGYLFAARLGQWRWDVRERHAAYRQRTPGAPT